MPPVTKADGGAAGWVRFSSRRSGLVLAVAALVSIAGLLGTIHLYGDLRPDMGELLPVGARSAGDIAAVTKRTGGWAEETVILHGSEPEELKRVAAALAPELEKIHGLVNAVEWRFEDEKKFFKSRRWLFPSVADLQALQRIVEARIARGRDGSSSLEIAEWAERVQAANPSATLFEGFEDGSFLREVDRPDGGGRTWALFMRVRLQGDPQDFPRVHALDREVRRVEAEIRGSLGGAPGVSTVFGGYVASAVFEQQALVEDLIMATALVLLAVSAALAVYFGTLKSVVVIGLPLGAGVFTTFGLADLFVGHVNPNTAFLGSIIVGNGVNVTLILLARYTEERRRGADPDAAMSVAVVQTWLATLTAALAAGIAYASLLTTTFRGFSQFGLIGGMGMALCWLAAYAVLPALVLLWERQATLIAPRPGSSAGLLDPLARAIERAPRAFVAAAAVAGIVSAFFVVRFARDPLEYDFSKLRDVRAAKGGEDVAWERAIFGEYRDPSIVLAADEAEARAVAAAFEARRRENPGGMIGSVVSVATFVPGDQTAKLEVIEAIRARVPALLAQLTPLETLALTGKIPPANLTGFSASDLPLSLRRRLGERDGRLGTPVLVSPAGHVDIWDGREAQAWTQELRSVPLPRGDIPIASSLLLFSDVLDAIIRDGPRATAVSIAGVVLLVFVVFLAGARPFEAVADASRVLGVLAAGVLLFLGFAGALGLKLNMLSFIAIPITFGIGADYAANMVLRQRRSGLSPGDSLRTTGGAVALCSLTTVLGYSSLLAGNSRALQSFGLLANLGEMACLAAALVLLPAISLSRR